MPLAAAWHFDSVFSEIDFVEVYSAGGCEDYFEEAVRHCFGVNLFDYAGERVAGALAVYVSVRDVRFKEATGGGALDFCAVGAVHRGNPSSPYQASLLESSSSLTRVRARAEFEFCFFEFDSSFVFQARELSSSSRARIRVFEFELSLAELELDSHH